MSNLDFNAGIDAVVNGTVTQGTVAPTGSPERAAKSIDLGNRSGVPAQIININPEKAQKELEQKERAAIVKGSPAVQAYIASDPLAAEVSSDDFGLLEEAYQAFSTFIDKDPVVRAVRENFSTEPLGIGRGTEADKFFQDIGLFKSPNRADPGTLVTEPVIRGAVAALDLVGRTFWSGAAGVGAITEELVAGANDLVGQEDFFGTPSRAGRETTNFINFWLLRMGVEGLHLNLGTRIRHARTNRLFEFLVKAEELRPRQKKPGWHEDPAQVRLENQSIIAEFDAAEFDAAMKAVVETNTRERAPGMVQDFVQQNLGERTVGVDPVALQKIYDEQGVAPGPGDPVMGFVPDIAERMEIALATGSDVEVPMAGYLARVDPAVHDKLIPAIRSRDGMTIAEAAEAQKEMEEAIEERRGDTDVGATPGAVPTDERVAVAAVKVQDKLYTGITHPDALEAAAEDLGISAEELIDSEGVRTDDTKNLEGFVTTKGRFVSREEALAIAEKTGVAGDISLAHGRLSTDDLEADPSISLEEFDSIEAQVVASRKSLYLDPLFEVITKVDKEGKASQSVESAGMTMPEFKLYSKRLETIQNKARAKDLKIIERQTTRELTEEWKATVQEELVRAQAEFDARKDVQAKTFLEAGGNPVVLDIEKLHGVSLGKGMAARGGVDPDEIAGLLGYSTGEELVKDLGRLIADQGRKTEEGYRKAVTEAIAGERARERFGDPGARAQEIIDLIADEDISKLLHDDLRVMGKQGGGEPLGYEELQRWARENFSKTPVKEARKLKNWVRAVSKNGRKAEMFLLKGDIKKAFKAKNEQLMATLWLQEALRFGEQTKGAGKDMFPSAERVVPEYKPELRAPREPTERGPTIKTAYKLIRPYMRRKPPRGVDPDYVDQIHKILDQYGVTIRADRLRLEDPDVVPNLFEFVQKKNNDEGYEITVADFLYGPPLNRRAGANRSRLDDLLVTDFEALIESIQSLEHTGKMEHSSFVEGKKIERETFRNQIIENIEELPLLDRPEKGVKEKLTKFRYETDALLVKMDRIFFDLDLRDPEGPFMQAIYYPMLKAEHYEDALFNKAAEILKPLRIENSKVKIPNNFINSMTVDEKKGITGRPFEIDRSDLVIMALNLGNRHNRDLLVNTLVPPVDSPTMGIEMLQLDKARAEQQVVDFVNAHMTEKDWAFVEGVWGFFRWIKPLEDQMYREISGVAPDTVEALPIETPFGRKTGGYMPVILNPLRGKVAVSQERASFEANYYKATTPNSYTKKRKTHFEPLMVVGASGLLQSKIRAAIHDVAFRREIIEAGKILYDPKIREVINKYYGAEYGNQLSPWLRYIANHFNEEDRLLRGWGKVMRALRKNLGVAVLGANLKTIATPQIGPVLAELAMSPAHATYILTHWDKYSKFTQERSGELRTRMQNMDRDVREALSDSVGMQTPKERLRADVARISLSIAAGIDTFLATTSWMREYERAIEAGRTEEEAIRAGDLRVVKYYGSASPVNLAAVLRLSESSKGFMTMFYGYMSTSYNLNRDIVQTARSAIRRAKKGDKTGSRRDWAQVLVDSIIVAIIPAMLGAVYAPQMMGDEDDSWGEVAGKLMLGHLMGTVPLLRDAAAVMFQDLPARSPPIASVIIEAWRLVEDAYAVANDDDPSQKWLKRAITFPGIAIGLPTGQIGTAAQFFWNVNNGEDDLNSLGDFIRGITYGTSEPGK